MLFIFEYQYILIFIINYTYIIIINKSKKKTYMEEKSEIDDINKTQNTKTDKEITYTSMGII